MKKYLWIWAFLTFVIGDTITTVIGLQYVGIYEANAHLAILTEWPILLSYKIIIISGFKIIYNWMYEPIDVGIPIGLGLLGTIITSWNVGILFRFFW